MKVSVIGPVMSVLRSFFLSLFLFPDLGRSICLNGCDGAGAGIVCNKDRAELSDNPGDDVSPCYQLAAPSAGSWLFFRSAFSGRLRGSSGLLYNGKQIINITPAIGAKC